MNANSNTLNIPVNLLCMYSVWFSSYIFSRIIKMPFSKLPKARQLKRTLENYQVISLRKKLRKTPPTDMLAYVLWSGILGTCGIESRTHSLWCVDHDIGGNCRSATLGSGSDADIASWGLKETHHRRWRKMGCHHQSHLAWWPQARLDVTFLLIYYLFR